MGFISNFKCVICETEFDVDGYDDTGVNKCPKCNQVYNYDEGLTPVLTKEQIVILNEMRFEYD